MYDPILVTLIKMQPHYSQSSRENATPFSGTSPLASYNEVPTPRLAPNLLSLLNRSSCCKVVVEAHKRKYFLSILSVKCSGQMWIRLALANLFLVRDT